MLAPVSSLVILSCSGMSMMAWPIFSRICTKIIIIIITSGGIRREKSVLVSSHLDDCLVPLPVADPPADQPVQQLLEVDVDGQLQLVCAHSPATAAAGGSGVCGVER